CGEVPYPRDSLIATMYAHLQDAPPTITSLRAELPAALDTVLQRSLAKRPEDRFSSCRGLARAASDAMGAGRALNESIRGGAVAGLPALESRRVERLQLPIDELEAPGAPPPL